MEKCQRIEHGRWIGDSYCGIGSVVYIIETNGEEVLHSKDGPAIIKYDDSGKIISIEYRLNGKKHRKDGPAYIEYYDNCKIMIEEYYINNEPHRDGGPAITKYYDDGTIFYEEYWNKGMVHREDGPAHILYEKETQQKIEKYIIKNKIIDGEIYEYKKCLEEYIMEETWG